METDKAKEMVSLLAYGIDPITGEVLPDDSPYNHPSVIRALFTILGSVDVSKRQSKQSMEDRQAQNVAGGGPRNAGLPWTEELKEEISDMFKAGTSIDELAEYFERTSGAIRSELMHQGLIEQQGARKGTTARSRTADVAMARRNLFTEDEIVLCTYIARFGRDKYDELAIHNWCSRSLNSIKMKVQNIAAMLDEEGYLFGSRVAPLSGSPHGESVRRTNWDVVSGLVQLSEGEHYAKCIQILTLNANQSLQPTPLTRRG